MKLHTYKPNEQGEHVQVFIKVDSLPAYFKSKVNTHQVKIISETQCIWVTNKHDISTDIDAVYSIYGQGIYSPSTPEEFNAAFEAAINHINELNK